MQKHIMTFDSFLNESLNGFQEIIFNSHKDHNPYCDIVEGHLDADTLITYGIYVKGEFEGEEFMELYVGSNYKPESSKRSNSRLYTPAKIPAKYLPKWQELKAMYETKYKNN